MSSLVCPAIAFIVATELWISGVGRCAVGTQGTSSAHHGLQRDVRIVGIETSTGHHGFWRKDQIAHGLGRVIQISGLILDLVASMVSISTSRLGQRGLVLRPYRVLPRILRHARTASGRWAC